MALPVVRLAPTIRADLRHDLPAAAGRAAQALGDASDGHGAAEAGDGGADAEVNAPLASLRTFAAKRQPVRVSVPAVIGGEHQGAVVAGVGAGLAPG
jgi:hypothetical protein